MKDLFGLLPVLSNHAFPSYLLQWPGFELKWLKSYPLLKDTYKI